MKDMQGSSEFQSVKEKLENIEKWEMGLVGSLNEEYDDWYCDGSEEFLYEDPEGVLDVIENACSLVHECIDAEDYHAAFEPGRNSCGAEGDGRRGVSGLFG